jgi:hypothetical protein
MAKSRSPNYPSMSLPQALAHANTLWSKEGRTSVPPTILAKHMGYSSLSGPARTKIAALKQYGLLDEGKDGFHLSELALRILHHPDGSVDREDAITAAAYTPDLFRELAQTHMAASDDALRAYLITKRKFTDSGAKEAIKAFRETIELVNLDESSYSEPANMQTTEATPSVSSTSNRTPLQGRGQIVDNTPPAYSWPLSGSLIAEVRFKGDDRIKPDDIEMLRQYLEIAEKALARQSARDPEN